MPCDWWPLLTLKNFPITVADIFQAPQLMDLAKLVECRQKSRLLGNGDVTHEQDAASFSLWKEMANLGSSEKRARLQELAGQYGIKVEQIEDVYPCVPLQEGLMAISTCRHGAYVAQRIYRLDDTISVPNLKATWEKLSQVVPILRTRIISPGAESGSMQIVAREQIGGKKAPH